MDKRVEIMRIAIVGAGGVGGYLVTRLASAGADVALLARGAHLAAIQEHGLRLREPDSETVTRLSAFGRAAEIGPCDLVIFGVKAQQLAEAIEDSRPLMAGGGFALPFQNGVDAPDMLAATFGEEHVLVGVARIFATIAGPGVVDKMSPFANFTIGDAKGRQSVQRVAAVRAIFEKAGIDVPDCADVRIELWEKFVMMNAVSGVTAAARSDIGTARAHPETWALFRTLLDEAAAVGLARGIDVSGTVDRVMAMSEGFPAELRASQAHDLEAGRPLEVDWLSGAVVRIGAELGIATPASAAVLALLAPWRVGRAR